MFNLLKEIKIIRAYADGDENKAIGLINKYPLKKLPAFAERLSFLPQGFYPYYPGADLKAYEMILLIVNTRIRNEIL